MKVFWQGKVPKEAKWTALSFCGKKRCFEAELVEKLSPFSPITIKNIQTIPNRETWCNLVSAAVQKIEAGVFEKVVLARQTILECAETIDPFAITAGLIPFSQGAHVFCLSDGLSGFVGATPELLFRRQGQMLESVALAGTKRSAEEFFGEKEKREWAYVKEYIETALTPFCQTPFRLGSPGEHRTYNLRHLVATGAAPLKSNVDDATILHTLHPTPALCGTPKTAARKFIEACEPFSRELYGGVIGWECESAAEFFVAIRCCKVEGNLITLYAGAGIVKGSHPESEWEELEAKTDIYLNKVFLFNQHKQTQPYF